MGCHVVILYGMFQAPHLARCASQNWVQNFTKCGAFTMHLTIEVWTAHFEGLSCCDATEWKFLTFLGYTTCCTCWQIRYDVFWLHKVFGNYKIYHSSKNTSGTENMQISCISRPRQLLCGLIAKILLALSILKSYCHVQLWQHIDRTALNRMPAAIKLSRMVSLYLYTSWHLIGWLISGNNPKATYMYPHQSSVC